MTSPPITSFVESDIPKLAAIQPADWRDVRRVFRPFIRYPWFKTVKIEEQGALLAVGEAINHGKTAWIGNIMVAPSHRRQGLGTEVTRYLRDWLTGKGVGSQFLLATEMGKGLYGQLGFKEECRYLFFKKETSGQTGEYYPSISLKDLTLEDLNEVIHLDQEVTGEHRPHLIRASWSEGKGWWSSRTGQLEAFYLPELGEGLVLARDREAGMDLLNYRIQQDRPFLVVPEQHQTLVRWAEQEGFVHFRTAYRMVYGMPIRWQPECIYSRIGGYLG